MSKKPGAPAPPQPRASAGAPPKPPTPPAVPAPPKAPASSAQPAPRARRSSTPKAPDAQNQPRAPPPPPAAPSGPGLADGAFDEDESRASFLAALQEWCAAAKQRPRLAACCVGQHAFRSLYRLTPESMPLSATQRNSPIA